MTAERRGAFDDSQFLLAVCRCLSAVCTIGELYSLVIAWSPFLKTRPRGVDVITRDISTLPILQFVLY